MKEKKQQISKVRKTDTKHAPPICGLGPQCQRTQRHSKSCCLLHVFAYILRWPFANVLDGIRASGIGGTLVLPIATVVATARPTQMRHLGIWILGVDHEL